MKRILAFITMMAFSFALQAGTAVISWSHDGLDVDKFVLQSQYSTDTDTWVDVREVPFVPGELSYVVSEEVIDGNYRARIKAVNEEQIDGETLEHSSAWVYSNWHGVSEPPLEFPPTEPDVDVDISIIINP